MKRIRKLLIIPGIIIVLYSCKPTFNFIGTYLVQNNPHKFIFNADSTFKYSYVIVGPGDKYSSGKWSQINGNTIVLNSNIQSNVIPLNVDIVPSNNKNPIINVILIVPGKDEKEYRCTPYTAMIENKYYVENFLPDRGSYSYEQTNYYSNEHELYFKVSKEPRTFERTGSYARKEYYVIDTEHKRIKINQGDIVNVTVIVPDSLFSYRIFNDEKVIFSKNKLIYKDREENNKTNKLHIKD